MNFFSLNYIGDMTRPKSANRNSIVGNKFKTAFQIVFDTISIHLFSLSKGFGKGSQHVCTVNS